ncbi:hypothetical protein NBRC3188_2763 [Acetobacter pasteurianus NBRC 3188]|uniref:Uncharacterized protein n=1 Tax=Acetobacter pasteurianus NBRC 3188 TaxID=1226663 RepID=A0A401WXM6_ACEPA|nr:hypothetical protein NBRC3188_2763 [Acetobacter pasteurianus NBRC 3188]
MKFKTVEDLREAYPNAFNKDGSVDLTGKSEIEELPNDWHVPGTLSLRQCTGLTRLPERLNIDGALDMRRCESVSHIPDDPFFRPASSGVQAGDGAVLAFQSGVLCCSIYCRMIESGAPPQDAAK